MVKQAEKIGRFSEQPSPFFWRRERDVSAPPSVMRQCERDVSQL